MYRITYLLQRRGHELREAELHRRCQSQSLPPCLSVGGAEDGADLVYLVSLGGAWEEGAQGEELCVWVEYQDQLSLLVCYGSGMFMRIGVDDRARLGLDNEPLSV